MEFTEHNLSQARNTKINVKFVPVTVTLSDDMVAQIESIKPQHTTDSVYADLLAIGLSHIDELSTGDISNMVQE